MLGAWSLCSQLGPGLRLGSAGHGDALASGRDAGMLVLQLLPRQAGEGALCQSHQCFGGRCEHRNIIPLIKKESRWLFTPAHHTATFKFLFLVLCSPYLSKPGWQGWVCPLLHITQRARESSARG